MFKFIKDISKIKERFKKSDKKIDNLGKVTKENNENISVFKKETDKHFKKQDMKLDELLDTLIELQEANELQEENENLVETIMLMLDAINVVSKYLKNDNIDKNQLNKQIDILKSKINNQLLKSKITLIPNEEEIFTPRKHEVVDVCKVDDDPKKHGEIKKTLEFGYMYKGKVIKKAKVEAYSIN